MRNYVAPPPPQRGSGGGGGPRMEPRADDEGRRTEVTRPVTTFFQQGTLLGRTDGRTGEILPNQLQSGNTIE